MLQIALIDENSQNLLKMLQTERHQTFKLTNYQNIIKVKEGGESVLIYT